MYLGQIIFTSVIIVVYETRDHGLNKFKVFKVSKPNAIIVDGVDILYTMKGSRRGGDTRLNECLLSAG